ncbi:MAG TPA: 30S ribosomal protein S16 [Anaerolineaceae bacterium]
MVRIRLRRVGLTHQASYRIMAADKEAPRDGRFLEILGFYNPRTDPATIEIKEDRLFDWMSKGAQPSESVTKLLKTTGAMDRFLRFKAGESIETLQAEAKTAYEQRIVNVKTRAAEKSAAVK